MAAAEAVLYGETTVVAKNMISEVVSVAKRDLRKGVKIGGIGGVDIFNRIYTYEEAREFKSIPMGIAPNGTALKNIKKGDLLTEDNFSPDTSMFVYKIRKMQDQLLSKE